MAVANPTNVSTGVSSSASTSFTVTMTANPTDNVIVFLCQMGVASSGSPSGATPTDNFSDTGGGSWTSVQDYAGGAECCQVWRRQIGTSASAAVITCNWDADVDRHAGIAFETTGHDTSSPISEQASKDVTPEDPHTTNALAGAATDNLIWAFVGTRAENVQTADADFTEMAEVTSGGGNNADAHTDYDPNDDEVDCTSDFGTTPDGASMFSLIVEVAIAGAAGDIAVLRRRREEA